MAVNVTSADDVANRAGMGSMAHIMAKKLFNAMGAGAVDVDWFPIGSGTGSATAICTSGAIRLCSRAVNCRCTADGRAASMTVWRVRASAAIRVGRARRSMPPSRSRRFTSAPVAVLVSAEGRVVMEGAVLETEAGFGLYLSVPADGEVVLFAK